MSAPLDIAPCTEAHLGEVQEIADAGGLHVESLSLLGQSHRSCWVASRAPAEPAVLGFIVVHHVADELEIVDLAVSVASRRHGVASALVAHVLAGATQSGARAAYLEVASKNQPAVQLYEKAGFRTAQIRRRYYPSGDDARVMIFAFDAGVDSKPSPV